jgi:hypothetical protein
MNKAILKTTLTALAAGQEINVTFRGDRSALSGNYRVLASKTGRGKYGSRLVELQAISGGDVITIGTPKSDEILNIRVSGGELIGAAVESSDMRTYPQNEARADALKEEMRPLLVPSEIVRQIRLTSALEPEFNGVFNVDKAQLRRGRHGQVQLFLTPVSNPDRHIEIWTYRHSTAVDSFEILPATEAVSL